MPLPIVPLAGAALRGLAGGAAPAARTLAGKSLPAMKGALPQMAQKAPASTLTSQVRTRMPNILPGLQKATSRMAQNPIAQEAASQVMSNALAGGSRPAAEPAAPQASPSAGGGILGHVAQAASSGGGLLQGAKDLAGGFVKHTPGGMLLRHTAPGKLVLNTLNKPAVQAAVGMAGPYGRAVALGAGLMQDKPKSTPT